MRTLDVRRDAIRRLCAIAADTGADPAADRYDPDLLVARSASLQVLWRRLLAGLRDQPALLAEVDALWPVARGNTEALIDARVHGLPDQAQRVEHPTLADVEAALDRLTGGVV